MSSTKKMVVKLTRDDGTTGYYRATKSFRMRTQAEATVVDDTSAQREWFKSVTRGTLTFINV